TENPVCVLPQTSIIELHATMARENVRHLLVCQGYRQLVGVIHQHDLQTRTGATAADFMTADPVSISSDMPLQQIAEVMVNNHVSCLPVRTSGMLNGVITRTDLLIAFESVLDALHDIVQQDEPIETLQPGSA
ncbi:MAG: CBS domain-containing protein, partial [Planctomycetota bacterium]|nr:CBS domain-containing protein [Planctomycetota bacterium]